MRCDYLALGGIIIGQELGPALGKRHIFFEKDIDGLALGADSKLMSGKGSS
jgi:hypothetical protein